MQASNIALNFSQPFEIPPLRIFCLDLYLILNWIVLLMSDFLNSICILDIGPLLVMELVKIVSNSVAYCLSLSVSFALQKLKRSHPLFVDFSACNIGVLLKSVKIC